jgi:ATP-dependent Clp protease protease subunit
MLKSSFTRVGRRKRIRPDNLSKFFDLGFLLDSRTIYIGDAESFLETEGSGINSKVAEHLIKGLHILNNSGSGAIRVIMNSPGGYVSDGFAIYDSIRSSASPVDIEVLGQASSMAAVILQAGRYRLLHPNALFLMHEGSIDLGPVSPRAQQAWAEWDKAEIKRRYEIFAYRSGKSPKFWEERCKETHDAIFDAQEAVKLGLADAVMEVARWARKI